ncbi:hypothetical protein EBX31_12865, partial [bacterium]|nr:hypothetical protein [bacterium]
MKKIVALFTLSLIFGLTSSQAQTNWFWDTNGATAGVGGTGSWTTTGTNWTTNSAGGITTVSGAWVASNSNFAYFQGTNGVVTIGASLYMNQVYVNTDGYTFTQSSTSANRYIYSTNTQAGIILADGITLNLSSLAVGYNSGALGIVGNITNATGVNPSAIAITGNSGTTAGSGIRIITRVGTNGTAGTNFWSVNLNIKTTGTGGAILGTADSGSWLVLRNPVVVDNGSRLVLSPGNGTTRTILVSNSITTSAPDAVAIGDTST